MEKLIRNRRRKRTYLQQCYKMNLIDLLKNRNDTAKWATDYLEYSRVNLRLNSNSDVPIKDMQDDYIIQEGQYLLER